MMARLCCVLAASALCVSAARVEERPNKKEQDARKDLLALQGTWQLESYDTNGKGKVDVKKRTFFVGGDLMLVQEGDKIVQAGLLRLNPGKSPATLDVVVKKGEHEDNTMLGIYELKDDALKLCIDPEGETRPKKFEKKEDTSIYVASLKRVKRDKEEIDVRGIYDCESHGLDKKKVKTLVEIQKRGDAYLVKWQVSEGVAFVGTGIRQGDTLSVAWVNRGSVGVSVYKIEKGPTLNGVYTEVGGPGLISKEVMTVSKKTDLLEVRVR